MDKSLNELREARAAAVHSPRAILTDAEKEARDLTADEREKYDRAMADADALEAKVEDGERRQSLEIVEARLKESQRKSTPAKVGAYRGDEKPDASRAFRSWLLGAAFAPTGGDLDNAMRCGVSPSGYELRVLKRNIDKVGNQQPGLFAWSEFYNGFLEEVKAYGPVLQCISYLDTGSGQPLPIPVVDDTMNEAEIVPENQPVSAADPVVVNTSFGAYKYSSKEVIVSLEALQDSQVDIDGNVRRWLAERFARRWAKDATVGDGVGKPFGIATRAGNSGVVAGGSAAAPAPTADQFIDLAESLDDGYKTSKCVFMMHPSTIAKIRKLKDVQGQYLWQPSLQAGTPDTFYGFPVVRNQAMPTMGANARIAVFGDLSNYVWRRVLDMQFIRCGELRIRNGQVSFLAFARADGTLPQANAVKFMAAAAT